MSPDLITYHVTKSCDKIGISKCRIKLHDAVVNNLAAIQYDHLNDRYFGNRETIVAPISCANDARRRDGNNKTALLKQSNGPWRMAIFISR